MTNVMAASIPQAVAERSPREIILAQSLDQEANLKFESRGCRRTKPTKVTCDVLLTNISDKRQDFGFGTRSDLITNSVDSSGTVYPAQTVQSGAGIAEGSGKFDISLSPGIPTKVTFIFEIPQEVTELAALDIAYYALINSGWIVRKTAITNIGAIAIQSNSAPPRQRDTQR
ncbi:MAG TPA: hypothetical protein DCZ55_12230 [Cyanobacteria bacterium UBA11371]|nr:hypothetical protein [Cyanobacteria bacterium UBA11371]